MAVRNGSIVTNARPRRHRRRAKSSAGDTTGKPIAKRTVLIPACAKRKRCRPRRGQNLHHLLQLPGPVGPAVDKMDPAAVAAAPVREEAALKKAPTEKACATDRHAGTTYGRWRVCKPEDVAGRKSSLNQWSAADRCRYRAGNAKTREPRHYRSQSAGKTEDRKT